LIKKYKDNRILNYFKLLFILPLFIFLLYGKPIVINERKIPLNLQEDEKILKIFSNGEEISYISMRTKQTPEAVIKAYFVSTGGNYVGPFHEVGFPKYSPDGKFFAFTGRLGRQTGVIVGSEKIGPFESITELIFISGGKEIAFKEEKEGKQFVHIGKDFLGPFDNTTDFVILYGGNPAFIADEKGKKYFVSRNKKLGPFDSIHGLLVSPDQKRFAFQAKEGVKNFVVTETDKYGPFEDSKSEDFRFSDDSKVFSFVTKDNNEETLHLGSEKVGSYLSIGHHILLNHGKNISYQAEINGDWFIFHNKKKLGPYDTMWGDLIISNDLNHVAFCVLEKNKYFVYKDSEKMGPYDFVVQNSIKFVGDNNSLSFEAEENGSAFVYLASEKFGPYGYAKDLTISPDGKTPLFRAGIGGKEFVIHGNEKTGPYDMIYKLQFSSDGKHITYEAEVDKKFFIFKDKIKFGPYDIVSSLKFSFIGKIIYYVAKLEGDVYSMIGREGKQYIGNFLDSSSKKRGYVFIDNKEAIIVEKE
jgi:hypothetical protein